MSSTSKLQWINISSASSGLQGSFGTVHCVVRGGLIQTSYMHYTPQSDRIVSFEDFAGQWQTARHAPVAYMVEQKSPIAAPPRVRPDGYPLNAR